MRDSSTAFIFGLALAGSGIFFLGSMAGEAFGVLRIGNPAGLGSATCFGFHFLMD
jgi:hypothetical protein